MATQRDYKEYVEDFKAALEGRPTKQSAEGDALSTKVRDAASHPAVQRVKALIDQSEQTPEEAERLADEGDDQLRAALIAMCHLCERSEESATKSGVPLRPLAEDTHRHVHEILDADAQRQQLKTATPVGGQTTPKPATPAAPKTTTEQAPVKPAGGQPKPPGQTGVQPAPKPAPVAATQPITDQSQPVVPATPVPAVGAGKAASPGGKPQVSQAPGNKPPGGKAQPPADKK